MKMLNWLIIKKYKIFGKKIKTDEITDKISEKHDKNINGQNKILLIKKYQHLQAYIIKKMKIFHLNYK